MTTRPLMNWFHKLYLGARVAYWTKIPKMHKSFRAMHKLCKIIYNSELRKFAKTTYVTSQSKQWHIGIKKIIGRPRKNPRSSPQWWSGRSTTPHDMINLWSPNYDPSIWGTWGTGWAHLVARHVFLLSPYWHIWSISNHLAAISKGDLSTPRFERLGGT